MRFNRSWLVVWIAVAIALGGFAGVLTTPQDSSAAPRDGRLGGTRETWEEKWGTPVDRQVYQTLGFEGYQYAINGFDTSTTYFYRDKVILITLYFPSDNAFLTTEHGVEIAMGFLPEDVEIDVSQAWQDFIFWVVPCHSAALERGYSETTYGLAKASGARGDCEVRVDFRGIEIRLGDAPVPPGPIGVPHYRGTPNNLGHHPGPAPQGDPVELWRAPIAPESTSSPVVWNGMVYAGGNDGNLYAFDIETGDVVWQAEIHQRVWAPPVVYRGRVFVGGVDDTEIRSPFVALNAMTGEELWRLQTEDNIYVSATVRANEVYVLDGDGIVHGLDAATGEETWTFNAGGSGLQSTPAFSSFGPELILGVSGQPGNITGIWPGQEGPNWQLPAGLGVTSPVVSAIGEPAIYYLSTAQLDSGEERGVLVKVLNGELAWVQPFGGPGNISAPAITDDNGIIAGSSDGRVYRLDGESGEIVWQTEQAQGRFNSGAVIVDDVVYIGGGDGIVYALNSVDGSEIWTFDTGEPIGSTPAIIDGVIYVVTYGGSILAIGGSAG